MKPTSCLFVSDGMGIMCRRKRIVGIEASRKVVKRTINHFAISMGCYQEFPHLIVLD